MMTRLSPRLVLVGAMLGATGVSSNALAADESYDPLDGKDVLAAAEKAAIEKGSSALADMGKKVLGAALDSYIPGVSALLGLSGEDTSTQKILDAIEDDGNRTRDLIEEFWGWARAQQNANIQAEYAQVEYDVASWNALQPQYRLANRSVLDSVVSDCIGVLTKFQFAPRPLDRIDYLHSYATVLALTIALESERTELQILGAGWEAGSGGTPASWWSNLDSSERNDLLNDIAVTKQQRVQALLLPGLQVSFATQMAGIDAGTLVGGVRGQSDFKTSRDWQFSGLSAAAGGVAEWFYRVGHNDPKAQCGSGSTYCSLFNITRGSWSSSQGQFRYYVGFTGGSGPFYASANAAYDEHKALALEGMITRGYGPVRAMSESLWDTWGLGERDRLGLDDQVDAYLEQADSRYEGSLEMLSDYQTRDITAAERGQLYGFALGNGLDAISAIGQLATDNRDYMDDEAVTRFSWSVHRSVIRSFEASSWEELASHYRAVSAAKFVAVVL
jgi:hypothetical protein